MGKYLLFSLSLITAFLISSCGGTQAPASAPSPLVGEVVTVGSPETRDLSPTTETVPNCGGSSSTIVKHPSMTVLTTHAIEWEIGGQVGVGAKIGEGVVPGGVDLSGTLDSSINRSNENGVQQGTAWDLPAEPNTIMEYTLMWREVWQRGYIDVKLADGRDLRINVTYRTGVQSDIVSQRKLNCESGQAIATQPIVVVPTQVPQSSGSGSCREAGGTSGFSVSTTPPSAPTNGCVLIVEWWVPPDASNCGLLITTSTPVIPNGATGSWWYVYPTRPDSHKQEFLAKSPQCKVEDLR